MSETTKPTPRAVYALVVIVAILTTLIATAATRTSSEPEPAPPPTTPTSSTTTTTIDVELAANYAGALYKAELESFYGAVWQAHLEAEEARRQAEEARKAREAREAAERSSSTSSSSSSPAPSSGANWDALAQCESGGNWAHPPVGSYGYSGGLMFLPSTWRAYGGTAYAPAAHQATRAQQIAVAERVLADVGRSAWPGCSAAGRW